MQWTTIVRQLCKIITLSEAYDYILVQLQSLDRRADVGFFIYLTLNDKASPYVQFGHINGININDDHFYQERKNNRVFTISMTAEILCFA